MQRQSSKSFQTIAAAQEYYRANGITQPIRVLVFGRPIILTPEGIRAPHNDANRTVAVPGVRL